MATMLDCKKIQPLLSEYIDGALPDEAAWSVKMHVSSCAVCAEVADELRATANLLSSLPSLEPSANFEAMLAKRLANQVLTPHKPTFTERLRGSLSGWWSRPLMGPAVATGVALAVLLPVAIIMNRPNNPVPATAVVMTPSPTPGQVQKPSSDNTAMDQLWRDHLRYASTEPLGDSAGLLTAANSGGEF